jgi:hypothetical protein
LTDIGFSFGFSGTWIIRFSDIGWIDMYQSTSDTKITQPAIPGNGTFALIFLYGFYLKYAE